MMENEFISWRGHRVRVRENGAGEPLLLITGIGGNTDIWTPLMEHFPNRRIIRFDAPGTGRSSTPMFPVPVATLANLAATVLENRAVPTADVIGYSYGGAIAQQLAHDHPERIKKLVLAATTCGIGGTPGSAHARLVLSSTLRYHSPSYFERTAAVSYGGRTGRNLAVRREMMLARHRFPPSSYGYAMQMLGTIGWSSWHFLPRIPHDTLVISGDDDPLIPVANAKLLAKRIPRAKLEIIERAGHMFLWDDAEHLATRIGFFLDPAQAPVKIAKPSKPRAAKPPSIRRTRAARVRATRPS